MLRTAISGCEGRMGQQLLRAVEEDDTLVLVAAVVRPGSEKEGHDAGELIGSKPLGVALSGTLVDSATTLPAGEIDVLIDFTRPSASLDLIAQAANAGCAVVSGTTGFSAVEHQQLLAYSSRIPLLLGSNMSVGVNVVFELLARTARILGVEADIEIVEAHHRNKLDAPSGTALSMGEQIAHALGTRLSDCAVYDRSEHPARRKDGSIGIASVRAGDIVGEHTVIFALAGERLEITHRATDRNIFALGALRAAKWVAGRDPGLYGMSDVLGLPGEQIP